MSFENAYADTLEFEVYEDSQAKIRELKQKLPPDLVASLAREVIRRIGSRDRDLSNIDRSPSHEDLERLCTALISDDDNAAASMIIGVCAKGTPAETVYTKYLAAAARMLGEWWDEDRADFFEVTIGTGRMLAIMRGMRHHFVPDHTLREKAAIFASVPGEDHTMGVRMAADLFRKDGWEIMLKVGLDHDELISEIEQTPNSIIGLSVSGRHSMDALSRLVLALHICCPHARILVSGQDIDGMKPLLSLMGLDGIATDIEDAKRQMLALWDLKITR